MQEAEAREAAEAAAAPSGATSSGTSVPTAEAESIPADPTDDDEDALLQKALAMSTADVDMGLFLAFLFSVLVLIVS